jgi:hypothetical protein
MRRPKWGIAKPTWSLYDIEDNPEHQLFESLIMEFNDISGIEVNYSQRDVSLTLDVLYGEHTKTRYLEPKKTKILYEVADEPNLWSSFGMYGGDIITAHMPQSTFARDVSQTQRPNIGDIVHVRWYDLADRAFEVAHVDDDDKAFQLKKLIWVLILRPYRYSEQSESAEALSVTSKPISAYGDNEWIEQQSTVIDNYEDVDTKIYGY